MSIYILIICQVKSGKCEEDPTLQIENTIIPKINRFLRNFLNQPYHIEFLSAVDDNALVDYNIDINNYTQNESFFQNHNNYYSMIILNGCDVKNIDFKNISELLCENGLLVISDVKCTSRTFDKLGPIQEGNINTYFEFNQYFYIKKEIQQINNPSNRIQLESEKKNRSVNTPIAHRTRSNFK